MTEILANSPNDISNRGATNSTLAQFKGKPRQLIVNIEDGYRPVIMDGSTLGGKFKVASVDEVNAVKTTAQGALTKSQADNFYLGKTATAASANKLATPRTIALTGAVTGTATNFDGSANISIPVTSVDGSKVTGTLSVNTTGKAKTADTALACSGNSATATHATSADTADKATKDASNNNIVETYATKTALNSTDSSVSKLTTKVSDLTSKVDTNKSELDSKIQEIKSEINSNLSNAGVPTGTILPFIGDKIPEGFLLCNGAKVATQDYKKLFDTLSPSYLYAYGEDDTYHCRGNSFIGGPYSNIDAHNSYSTYVFYNIKYKIIDESSPDFQKLGHFIQNRNSPDNFIGDTTSENENFSVTVNFSFSHAYIMDSIDPPTDKHPTNLTITVSTHKKDGSVTSTLSNTFTVEVYRYSLNNPDETVCLKLVALKDIQNSNTLYDPSNIEIYYPFKLVTYKGDPKAPFINSATMSDNEFYLNVTNEEIKNCEIHSKNSVKLTSSSNVSPHRHREINSAASRDLYSNDFTKIFTLSKAQVDVVFNLPDFNDRFIEGTTDTSKVGKKLEAGLPNITGKIDQLTHYWKGSTGEESSALKAFDLGLQGVYAPRGSNSNGCGLTFDASVNSSVYSKETTTVQPKSLQTLMIIKA